MSCGPEHGKLSMVSERESGRMTTSLPQANVSSILPLPGRYGIGTGLVTCFIRLLAQNTCGLSTMACSVRLWEIQRGLGDSQSLSPGAMSKTPSQSKNSISSVSVVDPEQVGVGLLRCPGPDGPKRRPNYEF